MLDNSGLWQSKGLNELMIIKWLIRHCDRKVFNWLGVVLTYQHFLSSTKCNIFTDHPNYSNLIAFIATNSINIITKGIFVRIAEIKVPLSCTDNHGFVVKIIRDVNMIPEYHLTKPITFL